MFDHGRRVVDDENMGHGRDLQRIGLLPVCAFISVAAIQHMILDSAE